MTLDLNTEPRVETEPPEWPSAIGMMILVIVIAACSMSCASTFYGADGKPTARIYGDYTYQRTAAGAVTITLKHSPVIRAGGIATTQVIGAAGTAVTAALAVP